LLKPWNTFSTRTGSSIADWLENHPFVDGNKRIGHAAMETFLFLNGYEINASIEEQERVILGLAAGQVGRDELLAWLLVHLTKSKQT
jgi:death on curing protein